jgi:aerobic C4-dicarboxylate transport protein
VIIAVIAGIIVGLAVPDVAKSLGVLGELFVKLIKMMITPVIFCTVVIGIGKLKASAVGKVGGLAVGYFLVMSTFALAIGLVVGNLIKPGQGLDIAGDPGKGAELAGERPPRAARWSSSPTSFRRRCSRR